ncbi:MAG: hypothetical protein NUV59_01280 [Patescibacteria group bacterium]|nr:hypothetical protein [Patescibacteria group bacterium]
MSAILHFKDEAKIADALGPKYKDHPAYDTIVAEILKGMRPIHLILADYQGSGAGGITQRHGW